MDSQRVCNVGLYTLYTFYKHLILGTSIAVVIFFAFVFVCVVVIVIVIAGGLWIACVISFPNLYGLTVVLR